MKDLAYKKLETEISRRIADGTYQPGAQLPTERELVEEFSVSRMTVAKGLTNLINSGTIERIRGRGTFVKHFRQQRNDNARLVKYISPGHASQQAFSCNGVLEGLCAAFKDSGFHVGIEFYRTPDEEAGLLRHADHSGCAGYVLWPSLDEKLGAELQRLRRAGFPVVLIDCMCPGYDGDFVGTDNFAGAQAMIEHLIELGHRRIAYLTIPTDRSSLAERLAGVIAGAGRHRLVLGQNDIGMIPEAASVLPDKQGALNAAFIEDWLRSLMRRDAAARPTAIFTSNDFIAMAAIEQLRRMRYRIPDDVSIAGFDSIDRAAWLPVPLTTLAHDFTEIGRRAGQVLLERLTSGFMPDSTAHQYRIRPELIRRESTRPSAPAFQYR